MRFEIEGRLPWFGRNSSGMAERKTFDDQGYCAVYIAGRERSLRLGWTGGDPRKVSEPVRVIVWCAGDLVAKRIVKSASQMLSRRRLDTGRYDVPLDFAERAICISAEKDRIKIDTHDDMMRKVKAIRQRRLDKIVQESEAGFRNAAQAAEISDASTADEVQTFDGFLNL